MNRSTPVAGLTAARPCKTCDCLPRHLFPENKETGPQKHLLCGHSPFPIRELQPSGQSSCPSSEATALDRVGPAMDVDAAHAQPLGAMG